MSLEQRRAGLAQPLEHDHLAGDDAHALLAHPRQRDVAVVRPARADRVGDDVDLLALLDQLERRLQHADVRLDADEDDLRPVARRATPAGSRAATHEKWFLLPIGALGQAARGSPATSAPEPLRVLLGRRDRHAEPSARRAPARRRSATTAVVVGDRRQQLLLQVDDEQQRAFGVDQHGSSLVASVGVSERRARGAAPRDHVFSSSRSRYCSSASGLASASTFFTGAAVHDVAHRELDDLVALGARDVGDLHDLRRHVARRRVGADRAAGSARSSAVVEREPVAQAHEQHDAHVADLAGRPVLADHEALDAPRAAARPGGRSRRCRCARRRD